MTMNLADPSGGRVNRRGLLRWMVGATVACAAPSLVLASGDARAAGFSTRRVALQNINTGEMFDDVYWRDGVYLPDAMKRIDVVLRDHRAGRITDMDPRLMDALWDVGRALDSDACYKVICGYRTRQTNNAKRRRQRGVARESFHVKGMAVDVALEGRSIGALAKQAKVLETGGVGVYRRSGFVHLDVGPVRSW